jgi:Protein of unknown function (DUF3379)
MIDHDSYRRALLADPNSESAELRAHREACAECSAYRERLLNFESRLERALKLKMPEATARMQPSRFALAASVLLALCLAGAIWLAVPRQSLAGAVVEHVADEPLSWKSQAPVADPALAKVLAEAHMHLQAAAGEVSYASACEFRGHVVPHLVVQSPSGPATVMVLVHEAAHAEVQFDEQGYRGLIVPMAGHGSIAILMRDSDGQMRDVEAIAARVRQAIVWGP